MSKKQNTRESSTVTPSRAVNFNDLPTHRKMVLASSEVLAYELSSTHLRPCGFASWKSSATPDRRCVYLRYAVSFVYKWCRRSNTPELRATVLLKPPQEYETDFICGGFPASVWLASPKIDKADFAPWLSAVFQIYIIRRICLYINCFYTFKCILPEFGLI